MRTLSVLSMFGVLSSLGPRLLESETICAGDRLLMKMLIGIAAVMGLGASQVGLSTAANDRRSSHTTSPSPALDGEWTGVIRMGPKLTYARLGFRAARDTTQVTVLSMQPGTSGARATADVRNSRVQFTLPTSTGALRFEGSIAANRFAGSVSSGDAMGRFEFVPFLQVNPDTYDDYAGGYELERGRLLIVSRGDELAWDASCSLQRSWLHYVDTSGETRNLFPVASDRFIAGPGFLLPLPTQLELSFLRGPDGRVSGVRWKQPGQPERLALRTRRYTEQSVSFQSGGRVLGARLLMPARDGLHPAVVLIQGGPGPGNRNSQYLAVANLLAANGIAALVYDKPGCGASTGHWRTQTYGDMARDAIAGLEFLQRQETISPRHIGLFGISEGGWIAPLAASQSQDVAFVVLLSAAGVSHAALDRAATERALRDAGIGEQHVRDAIEFEDLTASYARTSNGWAEYQPILIAARDKPWFSYTTVFTHTGGDLPLIPDHWFWRLHALSLDHDPAVTLRSVRVPVLAMWGGMDANVAPELNLPKVAQALREGGNQDYSLHVFGSGDHVLWSADKPNWIEVERYVPGYFEMVTTWVHQRVQLSRYRRGAHED